VLASGEHNNDNGNSHVNGAAAEHDLQPIPVQVR
jgi:hypothetical protein